MIHHAANELTQQEKSHPINSIVSKVLKEKCISHLADGKPKQHVDSLSKA